MRWLIPLLVSASLTLSALRPSPASAQAVDTAPRSVATTAEPGRALTITGVSVLVSGWVGTAALGLALGIGFANTPCEGGAVCPSIVAGASQFPLVGPIVNIAHYPEDGWVLVQTPLLLAQWAGAAMWIAGLLSSGGSPACDVAIIPHASPELVGASVRGAF